MIYSTRPTAYYRNGTDYRNCNSYRFIPRSNSTSDLLCFPISHMANGTNHTEPSLHVLKESLTGSYRVPSHSRQYTPILTPYQLQKKMMKSSFIFPNGESFTPKDRKRTYNNIQFKTNNIHIQQLNNIPKPLSLSNIDNINAKAITKTPTKTTAVDNINKSNIRKSSCSNKSSKPLTRSNSLMGSLKKLLNKPIGRIRSAKHVQQESNQKGHIENEDIFLDTELIQEFSMGNTIESDAEDEREIYDFNKKDALSLHPYHELQIMGTNVEASMSWEVLESSPHSSMKKEMSFTSIHSDNSSKTSGKYIRFSDKVSVNDRYSSNEYQRKNNINNHRKAITEFIMPNDSMAQIKNELNEYK